MNLRGNSGTSSSRCPIINTVSNSHNQDASTGDSEAILSELDDYFCALFVHALLISNDRETGAFGKLPADSDTQIAIEHMLQEAREMEESYALAKSLSTCGAVSGQLLEEMGQQDNVTRSDRELAERIERGESSAERSLHAASVRFELVRQHFQPFASGLEAACLTNSADISKYATIKREIENPCPPSSELDVAASRVISENGWK
ncbi:hypothetical protein BGZ97_001432, partial [Linnemannia gamsii]